MPCDGKNPNYQRRRELLTELKSLVNNMDRKKPCEWDEPVCTSATCCPADVMNQEPEPYYIPLRACKSVELRGSILLRCECIRRNGLQDRCMFLDCMGRPECMTKLYPVCLPGRTALIKLTDLANAQVALEKLYSADQARESALPTYCRLVCPENSNGTFRPPPVFITPPSSLVPCCGSAHSTSNQVQQTRSHNPQVNNQNQKSHDAAAQTQQQLNRPSIQRYQQPHQFSECYQQPYKQQQQTVSDSLALPGNSRMSHDIQQHSPIMNYSQTSFNLIRDIPGLKPIMPDGAMYMMVHIDLEAFPEFNSDVDFVQRLLMEESVFCLPGECFDYPSFMRLVITVPIDMQEEAYTRIRDFCLRHHIKTKGQMENTIEGVTIPY
ncbi:hypothetical protein PV327_005173 [Microctonus hyperodae]|uniref:Aminotransferase class I/classII large domain-containing protein n=1 Tax=Microctonus hyperodae TaxID=165561 RepID=A0AA39G138_MICHY|nr:hypothetical protein PV327_005173 [Microctonus hyperodae]